MTAGSCDGWKPGPSYATLRRWPPLDDDTLLARLLSMAWRVVSETHRDRLSAVR